MKKIIEFFCDKSLVFFLIIGGINTVVSTVGSQLLLSPMTSWWGGTAAYWASTAIMFTLCSVFSFIFNRKYSFESKAPLGQSIVRFSVVIAVCYLISFGFSNYATPFIVNIFASALDKVWVTRIAMLLGQVLFTGLNYLGQRLWAFKD